MINDDVDLAAQKFRAQPVLWPRAQVERQLTEAILSGQFEQGEKLPSENQLAEWFGVSRPTIREALGTLVAGGLIWKVPGVAGGSFVNAAITHSGGGSDAWANQIIGTLDMRELIQVRRLLEVPAARWAARNRAQQDLERLHDIVERQRTTTIDDPEIATYDLAFHTTIGHASGNRLLAALIAGVHEATHPADHLDVTREVGRRTVRQHMTIVAVIEAGNATAAGEAMETHLDYVQRYSTVYAERGRIPPRITPPPSPDPHLEQPAWTPQRAAEPHADANTCGV